MQLYNSATKVKKQVKKGWVGNNKEKGVTETAEKIFKVKTVNGKYQKHLKHFKTVNQSGKLRDIGFFWEVIYQNYDARDKF